MMARMQVRTFKQRLGLLVAFLLIWGSALFGQVQNGNIVGEVRDPSGAIIPAATVNLEEQQTGLVKRTVVTADDGTYRFALVPLGDYTITLEHPGFKKYANRDVHLTTLQTLRVDITLEVGTTAQQITVAAKAAAIVTDTAEISSTAPQEFLTHNPQSNWGSAYLQSFANIGDTNDRISGSFSFYGSRTMQATLTVDGQEFSTGTGSILNYGVQEVKTVALIAPAQYETQVNINSATKQGSNQIHGKVDSQFIQTYLWAMSPRSHVQRCSPDYICYGYWQAGLNAGGPVWIPKVYDGRNRTFWNLTYTPMHNTRAAYPGTDYVPSDAMKQGLLSAFPSTLVNPFTGLPFTGTTIPINSVTAKILSIYPSPAPGGNSVPTSTKMTNDTEHTWMLRLDQKITNSDLLTFSHTRLRYLYSIGPGSTPIEDYAGQPGYEEFTGTYAFGYTRTFSPHVVNEARFGWNFEGDPDGSTIKGESAGTRMAEWGMTGIPIPRVQGLITGPFIRIGGFTPLAGNGSSSEHSIFYHAFDNLSIQHGKHTFQTGFEMKYAKNNTLTNGADAYPDYNFDGRFTGSGFADFLLGLPGSIALSDYRPMTEERHDGFGMYLQDDWLVSPRLTLNLGVRYDHISPEWDANNLSFNWDPKTDNLVVPNKYAISQIDPAWPAGHPIVTAAQAGFPERLMVGTGRISPRIGFAYRPFNNQNTVIRGGFGMYIVPDEQTGSDQDLGLFHGNGPYALFTGFSNSTVVGEDGVLTPALQWPLAFPQAGGTYNGSNNPAITGINPNFHYPYSMQWNLTVERAFGRQGLRLSYIGTKDTQLGYQRNINSPYPSTTPLTSYSQLNYPNYGGIAYTDNGANAEYHSFEAELTTRSFFGITGTFGYAWAKQMSDALNSSYETVAGSGYGIYEPHCRLCDRAQSEFVPNHRFNADFAWDLPVGRGKKYHSNMNRGLNFIAGNWLLTSMWRARTGYWFNPLLDGNDPSNTNSWPVRPDVVPGVSWKLPHRNDTLWYNLAAFAVPPTCAEGQAAPCGGRFGNAGRNDILGPGMWTSNLAIFKRFPIREKTNFFFGAQAANVFNHPIWSVDSYGPAYQMQQIPINDPNAGMLFPQTSGTNFGSNNMRSVQFSAGFEF